MRTEEDLRSALLLLEQFAVDENPMTTSELRARSAPSGRRRVAVLATAAVVCGVAAGVPLLRNLGDEPPAPASQPPAITAPSASTAPTTANITSGQAAIGSALGAVDDHALLRLREVAGVDAQRARQPSSFIPQSQIEVHVRAEYQQFLAAGEAPFPPFEIIPVEILRPSGEHDLDRGDTAWLVHFPALHLEQSRPAGPDGKAAAAGLITEGFVLYTATTGQFVEAIWAGGGSDDSGG